MAALGTAAFTVDKNSRAIALRNQRVQNVTFTVGDGASTYPTNGVPLPSGSSMGFPRNHITGIDIFDDGASLFKIIWDSTHNTFRLIHPTQQTASAGNRDGVEYITSEVPVASTIKAQVWGF